MLSRFLRSETQSHRLDINRMKRKQRCHHEAAAGISGGSPQHPEQQRRVQGMQQNIGVVMSREGLRWKSWQSSACDSQVRGCQFEAVERGERPLHRVPVKAGLNLKIAGHIVRSS